MQGKRAEEFKSIGIAAVTMCKVRQIAQVTIQPLHSKELAYTVKMCFESFIVKMN